MSWEDGVRKVIPYVPGEQPKIENIIKLNTKTDSELEVYVGNIKKFTALPGSSQDKYAVRVTSVVREGDE